jgi:4-hydroxybenzoate polyprenyltransferase
MLSLDNLFASHATLTLAHIIPALLLVLLAPLIVYQSVKPPTWAERAFYPLGAIVGVTAYAMSVYSVGGWTERTAVLLFNSLFLFSLVRAWFYRSRNDTAQQHRWQLRAIAILLGIATTRPVMGVFFATSGLTHLVPQQFFGIAFWIGFSINVFVFELWMRFVDRRHKSAASLQIHLSQSRT